MQASAAAVSAAAAVPAAAVNILNRLDSNPVGWVTGRTTWNPRPRMAQTNNTAGFGIYGTDLGIMWENGLTGKIQLVFGDTFSGPNMTGA